MNGRLTFLALMSAASVFALATSTMGATICPATTLADPQGLVGANPGQFDRNEYEAAGDCTLSFAQNPIFDEKTASGALPPVAERIPADALVFQPYREIGTYGGTMYGVSLQPESGTSEILSWHHANLVRFNDDLKTVEPYVAKSFEVNDDATEIVFHLREGMKWSDGEPFTADDIDFWYNDLQMNAELNPSPKSDWIFGGEPMKVEKIDDLTIRFSFAAPAPNFLAQVATTFIEFFQPKHFLMQFHPDYADDVAEKAAAKGFDSWTQLMSYHYPTSDWQDVPQAALLAGKDEAVAPTLEPYIRTAETPTYREFTANPYFFVTDTAGNQLPYISEIREDFLDPEIQTLRVTQGGVTLKAQDVTFGNIAVYRENEKKGGYTTLLPKGEATASLVAYGLNWLVPDEVLAPIVSDERFAQALSIAINRDEVNKLVYFDQGRPEQFVQVDHLAVDFVTDDMLDAYTQYDPEAANALLDEMGLTERDGDGYRLRPDGKTLVLKLNYTEQGGPTQVNELVRDYWRAIGIKLELNQLGSDELGSLLEQNQHVIGTWMADGTTPMELANGARFAPPFNPRDIAQGTLWKVWWDSDGADGVEPPADVKRLYEIQKELSSVAINSETFKTLVLEAIDIELKNLFLIGVVGDLPKPIIVSNELKNFPSDRIAFYGRSYWRMYPYRPAQFFLGAE